MKSNFSSLENKKLENLKSISGGVENISNDYCYEITGQDRTDKKTYIDGKLVSTLQC